MRVLLFSFAFPPQIGGIQTMAHQLATHLSAQGVEVVVLALEEAGCLEVDASQPFRVIRIKLGGSCGLVQKVWQKLCFLRELNRVISAVSPDRILCVHWDPCAYLVRFLGTLRQSAPEYFVIAHGTELFQLASSRLGRLVKACLRAFALRGASRVIAVSRYTRERAVALGVDGQSVTVIPNGIARVDEMAQPRSTRPATTGPRLLTVSRLVPRKGHDTVLQALPKLVERWQGLQYIIAGDGPERRRLEAIVEQLSLGNHVCFYGQVNEEVKQCLLAECDVFVLPCRSSATDFEGFGIAFLEAMRWGKPVVAGRSGGVPDAVEHGKTGLLVPPNDPDALAAAIASLLMDPAEATRLGRTALEEVASR